MNRISTVILLLATLFPAIYAQQTYSFVRRDSVLQLDVYQPTAKPNGYTIVHVFGGGFIGGSRTNKWDADYCRLLADNGYTAVAIDYRLGLKGAKNVGIGNIAALENAFYMAAEDCSAAVKFLVENADRLGIAADKIILEGSSAGAITVLMTDFGRCNGLPCTAELPEGWKPAGVVAYSGAIYSKNGKLKWQQAPAPTLLFHGTVDKLVTYKQIEFGKLGLYGANSIVKRLEKYNYPYVVYRCKDLGHEVSVGGPTTINELNLFVRQLVIDKRALHSDITLRDDSIRPSKFTNMSVRDLYHNK